MGRGGVEEGGSERDDSRNDGLFPFNHNFSLSRIALSMAGMIIFVGESFAWCQ